MIIQRNGVPLLSGSTMKVTGRDCWSIEVESQGFAPGGELVTFRVVISRAEAALLAHVLLTDA